MLLGVASMFSGRDFGHWASNRGRRRRLPPSRGSDAAVNRCGSVQSASAAVLAARTASEMCVWTGDRAGEADALSNLGLLHWQRALALHAALGTGGGPGDSERVGAGGGPGDCESEDIRANLAALDGAAPNRDSTVGSPHVR